MTTPIGPPHPSPEPPKEEHVDKKKRFQRLRAISMTMTPEQIKAYIEQKKVEVKK